MLRDALYNLSKIFGLESGIALVIFGVFERGRKMHDRRESKNSFCDIHGAHLPRKIVYIGKEKSVYIARKQEADIQNQDICPIL